MPFEHLFLATEREWKLTGAGHPKELSAKEQYWEEMNRRANWDRGFENRKWMLKVDQATKELEDEDNRRKTFDSQAAWKPGMPEHVLVNL